ncbi:beta ketoadipyl CoA thiolase, TH2 [Patellaria atrata CBS 101060]|uniref:acetyl-CoA C-acyltransferase n=1 Tax=Patellaria atrata CBS 101060 TaxID=1346257 RepID=A0A9P4VVT0_9PEZI|nr:beta ketoadipyl CoA thiolase, TH2 [Patellaria atrata CBS 101060]
MAGYLHKGLKNIIQKHPNDIVFLSALRTPFTRAKKGPLRDTYDHELLSTVLKATLAAHPNLPPSSIQDISIGNVLSELGGSKAGRMAALHAGFPASTSFSTANRACASGLAAITSIAHSIAIGAIDVGIGGGMESMSRNYSTRAIPQQLWGRLRNSEVKDARDCIMPMGLTAENVAERYGVSRAEQDEFAAESQRRAVQASSAGWFDAEIVPVTTEWIPDPSVPDQRETITVARDDGIRSNTTVEKLASMKPAFKDDGTCTAGNSSQVSDGAGAVLLARRSIAHEYGLGSRIIGKWAGSQVVGCAPDEMGIGPTLAVPALLEFTGVRKGEVHVWELNEAFAAQAVYCVRKLGLERERVNPRGGAIALGHPLGATGVRLVASLLGELGRHGEEVGVASLCIGTGMGMASLIIRE